MLNFKDLKKYFDNYIDATYLKIKQQYFNVANEEDLKTYNHRMK